MERGNIVTPTRWAAWLNAAALLPASLGAVTAMSLQVKAGAEIVAVAFPPWWTGRRAFLASANAAIVRMTALPTLLVVRPDDNDGLARLRKAGAWLALDPQAIAAFATK
jgi:hypothetical protein